MYLYADALNTTVLASNGKNTIDSGAKTALITTGKGNDVIFGFENNDMLKITGTFSASYKKSNDAIYFKVGSTKNAITLKNFDATSFNINGKNYAISGKKLVRR